jgi:hypothetical protein
MKTPSKRKERHGQIQTLTIQHLEQLTQDDLRALADYAERRMDWLPSAPLSGEDMVHKALHSIIRGTHADEEGRRPRLENLKTKEVFLHYVRSAINSVVEAAKRKRTDKPANHSPWSKGFFRDGSPVSGRAGQPNRT